MNSLKLRLFRVLLLCAGTGLLVAGCSNDDDSPRELSSKTTLTLSKYYNDKGATTLPTWGRNDKAGLFAADQSVPEAVYAAPIQPGSQKSLFLFTLSAPQHAASTVVAFWPSDADLRCENGTLKTVVPTAQTGSVAPILAGKATARLNTYEGCSMELTNLFCTMYVSVKKGNYSVSKAVVKANGGEGIAGELTIGIDDWSASASAQTITVTLPAPLDCSKETQLIPVMIAPVALSQGYTVTLTDTDGNSFSVGKTEPVTLEAGGKHETDDARSNFVTELIFCGDNMVYMIDAGLANETTYKDAVDRSRRRARARQEPLQPPRRLQAGGQRQETPVHQLLQLVRAARHRHEGGAVPHYGDSQRPLGGTASRQPHRRGLFRRRKFWE